MRLHFWISTYTSGFVMHISFLIPEMTPPGYCASFFPTEMIGATGRCCREVLWFK